MDAETKAKLVDRVMQTMARAHAPFPYLIVRYMPAIYGVAPLPDTLDRAVVIRLAQREHRIYSGTLRFCAVFGLDDAVYIGADGQPHEGPRPMGGHTFPWPLSLDRRMVPAPERAQ